MSMSVLVGVLVGGDEMMIRVRDVRGCVRRCVMCDRAL